MTREAAPKAQWLLFVVFVLLALSGLCTIFVSVVTAAEAWQEHAEAGWPEATARIDRCGLEQASTRRPELYYIHCRLSYTAGTEQNVANLYSGSAPSRAVWQYPPNQIGPLEDWIEQHPPGTPIAVHYDPADRTKIALVANDMPRGGPRTASNLRLLAFWAGSFLVLLTIARLKRRRSGFRSRTPSVPLN